MLYSREQETDPEDDSIASALAEWCRMAGEASWVSAGHGDEFFLAG